jgi:phenylalanyl-tRNA synthetase alpha chain
VATTDLVTQLEVLGAEFASAAGGCATEQDIRALQARFLGKKGTVSQLMKQLGAVPPEARRELGAVFNRIKESIEGDVARRLGDLENASAAADLGRTLDVSLPGRSPATGRLHLLTQIRQHAVDVFGELGFEVAEGPQIDTDFHCFEALAIPKDHPARDMQDTFYVSDDVVLRPHTSPVQIRVMQSRQPPVRIVAPGVVYRRDDDATHSPMFMQIEGLLVDEHVRFSDLKGVMLHFVRRTFGSGLDIRFRPSYFPFVEPGAEIDMQCAFCRGASTGCRVCKGTGWVEIAGSGMVDPEVFGHVGYDAERYTGFAFGMGLERVAMLVHGVSDIKHFYEGDLRFLAQF